MSRTSRLIARVRGQLALAGAAEDLQTGAAAGAVALVGLFGARAFGWSGLEPLLCVVVGVAVALVFPLVGLFVRRFDRATLALEADTRLALSERVSTSLWAAGAAGRAGPLGDLVVEDAEATAAGVSAADIREAFRPRLLRRQLGVAAAGLLACAGLYFVQPPAEATESPAARAARLADENRIAEVARKVSQASERVEKAAKERKQSDLEVVAGKIQRDTAKLARTPPARPVALRKMNELSDLARDAARRKAGIAPADTAPEAAKGSRELAELLRQMSQAGLENLQKDLAELQERLAKGDEGSGPPSSDELRALANRLDALRQAMERAGEMGAGDLRERLRSIGNEDLLEQIAERLRELASKMEQQPDYQGLQNEEMPELDISQMSREELEQLLKELDEMAAMEDLARMLQGGGGEMSGGRRLRLGGSGGT